MADEEWKKELAQFDERTTKRRARAKEQDDKAQDMIRERKNGGRTATTPLNERGAGNFPALLGSRSV